ncbi:MAG: hypothetical protein KAW12_08530 [Candidatus Aminicenantes bacterium]|nr:hypothetical protein [Candidatus Aminicenantes bacterium]
MNYEKNAAGTGYYFHHDDTQMSTNNEANSSGNPNFGNSIIAIDKNVTGMVSLMQMNKNKK